jgi:hypothetical protein
MGGFPPATAGFVPPTEGLAGMTGLGLGAGGAAFPITELGLDPAGEPLGEPLVPVTLRFATPFAIPLRTAFEGAGGGRRAAGGGAGG